MTTPEPSPPPLTGVASIDQALAEVDLSGDVTTHQARLAAALEVLQRALNSPPAFPEPLPTIPEPVEGSPGFVEEQ